MLFVGLAPVACCAVWLLGLVFKNMKMQRREWLIFGLLFVSGMAIIAFSAVDPPASWDLSRHYEQIEAMQRGGLNYILNQSVYAHLPVANFLFAFVAMLGVPSLLPGITTIICYSILFYILADWAINENASARAVGCAMVFNLALCPFFHMVSGIRNTLSFAVAALGFYLELKKGRKIIGWLLYIVAVFIHPSAVLLIGLRVLLPIYKRWKWVGLVVALWSLMADLIASILVKMPIKFISTIGFKLYDYIGETEINTGFSGYKILAVKMVLFISMFLVIAFINHKTKDCKDHNRKNILLIAELALLLAVGSFKAVFIADRLCFFIAFMAIPALLIVFKECKGRIRYFFAAETVAIGALLFVHQILYFING